MRKSLKPYESYPMQQLLSRTANKLPGKTAIIDRERHFTYQEIESFSSKLSNSLIGMGIKKGQKVGILAPNCAEYVIAFYGIIKAGAVVTTINSGYREREIAHQISDSDCEILILHGSLQKLFLDTSALLKSPVKTVVIEPDEGDSISFWDLITNGGEEASEIPITPETDLAALPYSSGTTGLTKGVMLSHFNLVSNVQQLLGLTGLAKIVETDIVLVHLPLFHIYGMNILMNGCIGSGATQVMMGRFEIKSFLDLIETEKITKLFTVPPVGLALSDRNNLVNHDLSSLNLAFFGAAPLSAELQERIQKELSCPVIQGYGLTESSPLTNADFAEPHLQKLGSIGPGAADTEQKIVDVEDSSKEMSYGEAGELIIRGPQVMKGYYKNKEATSETISSDGWLHTGDIGIMDEEGYVWILDRKKELIKYKGFQVPPAELEGLLIEHPGIADAAVIGLPDLESGEIPKAFVVKSTGSTIKESEVMEYIAEKVATFKQIRDVEFVETIPKNPSGKILRRLLKNPV